MHTVERGGFTRGVCKKIRDFFIKLEKGFLVEFLENRRSWENQKPPENRQKSGLFWAAPFTMHLVCKLLILQTFWRDLILYNLSRFRPEVRSQKRTPKPKNRTNSAREFSEQFEGFAGHCRLKQGFWGKSHQKVHPKVRRNLCRKVLWGTFLSLMKCWVRRNRGFFALRFVMAEIRGEQKAPENTAHPKTQKIGEWAVSCVFGCVAFSGVLCRLPRRIQHANYFGNPPPWAPTPIHNSDMSIKPDRKPEESNL